MKKILILLLALLLLAGCGQKSDDTPAGGDTAVATSATIATDTDVNTMDSSIATDGTSFIAITLCMSGLTQLDEAGVPVPDLAESWTVSEDGLKYEFTIRDSSWSNGTKITANDFVYGWSRLFDPNTASDYAFLKDTCHIVNFYADGDSKFVVELDIPCDFLLSLCAFPSFFALNEEFVEAQGDQYSLTVDNMIYSGPYKMASWTLGDSYTFEKNESYWDAASYAENVDSITFRLIQGQSAILDYEAGNIDYVKLTSEVIDDYADREDVVTYASGYAWYLSLNYHNEYLANAKVRQAIAYAVNTEEMCDTVLKDGSVALKGIVSSNFAVNPDGKDYRDIAGQMTLGYDVDKAKALVEEAKAELGVDKIELDKSNPRIARGVAYYGENITSETMALLLGSTSEACASLRESIRENGGIIHPIVVNKRTDGSYVVIEGNTRLQIYKKYKRCPCFHQRCHRNHRSSKELSKAPRSGWRKQYWSHDLPLSQDLMPHRKTAYLPPVYIPDVPVCPHGLFAVRALSRPPHPPDE